MIDPALIRHALPERLTTERLELRRDAVDDAVAIFTAVRASRAELAPWLDWATPEYDLREALRAQRRAVEYWDAGDSFQWRIWRRDAAAPIDRGRSRARCAGEAVAFTPPRVSSRETAELLGSIDLHTIDWAARTAELGYWLDTRATGHGYLVEAGAAIVQLAATLLGFASLSIRCHPDNPRSIATARRLGFTAPTFDLDGTVRLHRSCG